MDEAIMTDNKKSKPARGLGRGLSALFEDDESFAQGDNVAAGTTGGTGVTMMGVDQLESGSYQPRRQFDRDSISDLAKSVAEHGIIQPLIVRAKTGHPGVYEIIAGERRWRAAQEAQLHQVPVIIRKDMDDETTLEIALIENLQREDLNPMDEAFGYQQLMDEFHHTQDEVAKALGKSRPHVANMLRLIALPTEVQDMLRHGRLTAGHAKLIASSENPTEFARQIAEGNLSVRDAEKSLTGGKTKPKKVKLPVRKDQDTIALEKELGNAMGTSVSIDMKSGGTSGNVTIGFKNLDQLDEFLRYLSRFTKI